MKTAISIPDAVFQQADRFVKRKAILRSELQSRIQTLIVTVETTKLRLAAVPGNVRLSRVEGGVGAVVMRVAQPACALE